MRRAPGKAPGKARPGRGRSRLLSSQAHLNGSTLENRLDVLGNHVDVGLPLGWWVGQVCVVRLQGTSGVTETEVGERPRQRDKKGGQMDRKKNMHERDRNREARTHTWANGQEEMRERSQFLQAPSSPGSQFKHMTQGVSPLFQMNSRSPILP